MDILQKLAMKIGDLVVETIMLIQILESGAPVELVVTYTVIVISSVLACAIMMFISQTQAAITENLVDLIFDMLIVVGYPVLVLYYCLSLFTFDRAKYSINLEVFPPGWFENTASAIADPVEYAIIYKNLASLRITSFLMFFTRVGVNAALGMRLHDIVTLLQDPKKHRNSVYPKRHRLAALGFVIYAVLLAIFVEESLRTSEAACHPYSECVVFARRWIQLEGNTQDRCPCLMLVDCDFAPTTYAEWQQPKDATKTVAMLASMGLLQTLKLTNRYLPEFPAELRDCTNLKYLSLIYTHTTTLPDWFHEFSKLEYFSTNLHWQIQINLRLHVEGKFISSLQSIPEGLFDSMTSLTAIHFGWHPAVTQFPSLTAANLKSLTLAGLISLQQIPSFESLYQLERLVISALPLLDRFPDLSPVKNLLSFDSFDRGTWCCNGYLGKCDLENPMCMVHPVWGTPAASCLAKEDVASDTTLEIASKFTSSICGPVLRPTDLESPLTEDMVAQCNGTLYRRCELPGFHEAMCFNLRFTVISCIHTPFAIEMRRRQIQERVGDPCNPEYEAWLGCTKEDR
ncbi:Hypothetical protein PHPALM_14622 [Phytophthora palmivora]|uniref:WLGC domain-containing protein n=1 Tax=Phytophthora palmivora TaxID=4796 RepID=A0A2P4XUB5_9STRA|nr:Hypothetical protein PHPALM_14622 [Phytophthora palmivora]